jgi:hypothetical protein
MLTSRFLFNTRAVLGSGGDDLTRVQIRVSEKINKLHVATAMNNVGYLKWDMKSIGYIFYLRWNLVAPQNQPMSARLSDDILGPSRPMYSVLLSIIVLADDQKHEPHSECKRGRER